MKLIPIHDRLLVKRLENTDEKIGSIVIPEAARERPQFGIVIGAGEGRVQENGNRLPMSVKEGDKILFGKYAGQEISVEQSLFLILREDEVLAVARDEAEV